MLLFPSLVISAAQCESSLDCGLNGDCILQSHGAKYCECDPAWSGNSNCTLMAFDALERNAMPGYYNLTESSWGGLPIEDGSGGYKLVHAQMAHGCGLETWTTNSIVALSSSVSGKVEGPYQFERELLPPFAHNPTVRRAPDGTYLVYFIGGWKTQAQNCTHAQGEARRAEQGGGSSSATCDGHTWPKSCGPAMPGPSNDTCGPADAPYSGNAGCGIALASAPSLDGPWSGLGWDSTSRGSDTGRARRCGESPRPEMAPHASAKRLPPTPLAPGVQPLSIVDQWRSDEVYVRAVELAPNVTVMSWPPWSAVAIT